MQAHFWDFVACIRFLPHKNTELVNLAGFVVSGSLDIQRGFMKKIFMLCLMLGMVACGGPVKRVFPPQVSLQEVVLQADGQVSVKFRIQNFSTVQTSYSRIYGSLKFADSEATTLDFNPEIVVGPGSNEIVLQHFRPNSSAQNAINTAIKNRSRLAYTLNGEITSSEPRGRYEIKYQSALNPVPGLSGTLR